MGSARWRRTRVRQETGDWQETASVHRTAELLVVLVVASGLLTTAALDQALSAFQLWALLTALAIGYLLSRGLARSGVPWRRDTTTTTYQAEPVPERIDEGARNEVSDHVASE
jgi:hypothetical protein